ncbi:MAG: 2-aminoadipate transaminase [Gaiellaceae bacterium]|nr:2-aminoadipate transaminase [Gaiellaceae bacterium]
MSVLPETGTISFARGIPSPEMFPIEALAESARRAVVSDGRVALNYGPPAGFGPLREWLGARHGVAAERVVVTPGSLIGLNFVVTHALADGGTAIVEAPTYDRMLHALSAVGADVVTVDNTDDGLDLDRLRELAARSPKPKLLYVLPTFHNPTGRTLTLAQRRELAAVAVEHELLVFEDDPYGLLRIEGEREPYVHELLREAGGDHLAVFASSFSKSVAPGLRVGYLVLPEALVAPIEAIATRTYVSPPLLPQAQLLDFLASGAFEPHLEFLASFLRPRRDALLERLEADLSGIAQWTRPEGGYFLWLVLPREIDTAELNTVATARGVSFVPGAGFFGGDGGHNTARLSFSYPSVEEIREGARRLTALIRENLDR